LKVDPKSFGRFLRQLRENKDYSINQLALYSGISAAHISRLERGLRPIPSPDTIRKLAKPLGITYEELMKAAGYLSDDIITEAAHRSDNFMEDLPPDARKSLEEFKEYLLRKYKNKS